MQTDRQMRIQTDVQKVKQTDETGTESADVASQILLLCSLLTTGLKIHQEFGSIQNIRLVLNATNHICHDVRFVCADLSPSVKLVKEGIFQEAFTVTPNSRCCD